MYKEIGVYDYAKNVLEHMNSGVFLTTKDKDLINTMTIGWGGIFRLWGKPYFIVLVRESRATYKLIENSMEFTISVPEDNKMKIELSICGTKSLRDIDKFEECNITALKARKINTPVIKEAKIHYECKVNYKQKLAESNVIPDVKKKYYQGEGYHTVYYGIIVDQYIIEEKNDG
ncbi:MAG: flavin reductase family protein [Candidatus Izimaplasma sp.]|nr:flavin reductase family protein [Candidatus Izimaplasma bacterium]